MSGYDYYDRWYISGTLCVEYQNVIYFSNSLCRMFGCYFMLFQYSHVLNVVVDLSNMQKCLLRTLTVIFVNPSTGKTYDLFRYRKKPWTCLFIKQLYSRYAYIAFRENSHLSMEAQLILNHFLVYKNFMYSDEIIKKRKQNAQNKKQNMYFLKRLCKHDVISYTRLFSALKEKYPIFLSDMISYNFACKLRFK